MADSSFPYTLDQVPEIKISYHPYYSPLDRWTITDSFKSYSLFQSIWDKKQLSYKEHCVVAYLNGNKEVIGICRHHV